MVVEGKEVKSIFVVTGLKFGYSIHFNRQNKRKKILTLKRRNVWGWFEDKIIAREAVKENWGDMYEKGYYNSERESPRL